VKTDRHLSTTDRHTNHELRCTICRKVFKRNSHFKRHLSLVHKFSDDEKIEQELKRVFKAVIDLEADMYELMAKNLDYKEMLSHIKRRQSTNTHFFVEIEHHRDMLREL